jgi:hypothetical protein
VYRSGTGSLLAFAAVLVTLTSRTGPDLTRSLPQAVGAALAIGLAWLLAGAILIGVRLTLLLL